MQVPLMLAISVLAGLFIAGAAWLSLDIAVFVYHTIASRKTRPAPSETEDGTDHKDQGQDEKNEAP